MTSHDFERLIELEFVRATENAALHSLHWMGRGDKESADEAACDAIRGMFDLIDIRGEVVIGRASRTTLPEFSSGTNLAAGAIPIPGSTSRSIRSTARATFPRGCRTPFP